MKNITNHKQLFIITAILIVVSGCTAPGSRQYDNSSLLEYPALQAGGSETAQVLTTQPDEPIESMPQPENEPEQLQFERGGDHALIEKLLEQTGSPEAAADLFAILYKSTGCEHGKNGAPNYTGFENPAELSSDALVMLFFLTENPNLYWDFDESVYKIPVWAIANSLPKHLEDVAFSPEEVTLAGYYDSENEQFITPEVYERSATEEPHVKFTKAVGLAPDMVILYATILDDANRETDSQEVITLRLTEDGYYFIRYERRIK